MFKLCGEFVFSSFLPVFIDPYPEFLWDSWVRGFVPAFDPLFFQAWMKRGILSDDQISRPICVSRMWCRVFCQVVLVWFLQNGPL